ncbi:MAG: transporter substrate-binding domain-containing protein [Lentisphaeria bacterium]|nr:transporter substrate-binding domain-containing protein [Candidatus Neomarinimicrobiota bacterium]MCF7843145.1 transporter substrate-binding domain-containing protein [Lentisphaeria bacterium]
MVSNNSGLLIFINRLVSTAITFLVFTGMVTAQEVLRVHHHQDYPPLEFINEASQSDGFDIAVWNAIAEEAGLAYTLTGVSWDSLVTVTQTGDFDVLTGIYFRVSQKQNLDFSRPYLTLNYSLYVPAGSAIRELHDPIDKDVVIVGGGTSSKLIDDVYAIRHVKKVDSIEEAIALLHSKSFDCAVLPTLQASYYLKINDIDDVIPVGGKLLSRNLCFAVPAGDSLLLSQLNAALTSIEDAGILADLRKEWIAPYEENVFSARVVFRIAWILFVSLTLLGIGVIGWTRSLQRSVKFRTRELQQEIRDRKRIARQLAQSNDLKALLIDIISHDLKNPAGVIKGMTELIEQQGLSDDMLPVIRQSSENLLNVIENATTLADLAVGESIEKEPLELRQLLQQVLEEFRHELEAKGMETELILPADYTIHANPIIAAVFRNFISNAIKYATSGKRVVIDTEKSDNFLTIRVKDFGKTLPESARSRVFERTFQMDTAAGHGSGLGLAIVKRIAEAHGGKVGVFPNEPTGNVFYLRLPV